VSDPGAPLHSSAMLLNDTTCVFPWDFPLEIAIGATFISNSIGNNISSEVAD
jgi:delta 1-pyrroline-5-carboxylate dehydrogenase